MTSPLHFWATTSPTLSCPSGRQCIFRCIDFCQTDYDLAHLMTQIASGRVDWLGRKNSKSEMVLDMIEEAQGVFR